MPRQPASPTGPVTAPPQAAAPSDFNIKPPGDASPGSGMSAGAGPTGNLPAAGQTSGSPATGGQTTGGQTTGSQTGTPISAAGLPGEAGMSATETAIGVAILLVLAVAILFVRGAVRNHLIAHRASPSAAGSAGWALFALLLSLSVLIVFGLIGALWGVLAFTVPLALVILVTLVLFVVLYRSAAQGRSTRRVR